MKAILQEIVLTIKANDNRREWLPFAAGVADEGIGYQETAVAFCGYAKTYIPLIFILRRLNSGRFESAVKLYDSWSKRLAAQQVRPVLKKMLELSEAAEKSRIKPLPVDF